MVIHKPNDVKLNVRFGCQILVRTLVWGALLCNFSCTYTLPLNIKGTRHKIKIQGQSD